MEVITSHTNADFDTFASMVAAKKLYPSARLVLPGSMEKKLRDALKTIRTPYELDRLRDIDLDKIKTLILVDVRSPGRIGPFAEVAARPGVEVHIYDHHPSSGGDLRGSFEVTEPYGSTTTVLTHLLMEKGIRFTPEEATILMAGIYEDTGSLSYPSTTTKDYEAASCLLSAGADLGVVSNLLRAELTPEEISLLNDFLRSETTYSIGGIDVVVAEGYMEKYTGDIAGIAHKIRDIEGMPCLFMLVDSGDRIHLVARSSVPRVNAGVIARVLGGGGHPNAASATMKGVTLIQAREKLLAALKERIIPAKTAADVMSFPPITIAPDKPVRAAVELMLRYNINAVPVVKDGGIEGVVTRQVVDKAAYHGLGAKPLSEVMTVDCESVEHDVSIDVIREKVIKYGQRLLPVMKEGRLAGVITRTDLLKLLQEELVETPGGRGARERGKVRVIKGLMRERLPRWLFEILKDVGVIADELNCKAYVVGGFVRDLLLRRDNLDVDIVIEGGDGVVFSREFALKRDLRVRAHTRFKTAVLIFPDGFKIDVATARLEYYEKPGSLPTIEQSSLKLDLYRRDFIINTLAAALNPGRFGEIIDFFGAQKDIKDKKIRVLHNLSFVEDPTRAFRAVRFSEKFGFVIEKHTLNLIRNAVKLDVFTRLSGARLLDELKNILEEDEAGEAVKRLAELKLLKYIHRDISWDKDASALFDRVRESLVWHKLLYTEDKPEGWLVFFLALTDQVKDRYMEGLTRRLSVAGKRRVCVVMSRSEGKKALEVIEAGLAEKNSTLYDLLSPLPLEVVIYLMAKANKEETRKALSTYITKLKSMKTHLKGRDLKRMGFVEGTVLGEALKLIFTKRLDNELFSRADEEMFANQYLSSRKEGKAGKRVREGAK